MLEGVFMLGIVGDMVVAVVALWHRGMFQRLIVFGMGALLVGVHGSFGFRHLRNLREEKKVKV